MRQVWQFQADRIEQVLASHKVPSRVTGADVAPRLIRFHLLTPLGVKVRQVANLAEEIALSLGASSCRVFREEGRMEVEVPRPDGQVVPLERVCRTLVAHAASNSAAHDAQTRRAVPPFTAVLGVDQQGAPLLLPLPSPNVAHVLIAGTTGSGKTALARSIIASLVMFNSRRALQLVLIDPKGRGFSPFAGLGHLLAPVISRCDEALAMLQRLIDEMERRDREGRSEPRLVVVLDELADLVQVGGKEMEAALTRLTQRGREAGIHVVACTQKPTAAVIGGLVKSNFPVRLVGAVTSPEDAKVATGLAQTGAERLLGQGDFLVVAQGTVTRMQAAYLSSEAAQALVERVNQAQGTIALGLKAPESGGKVGPESALFDRVRSKLQLVR